MLKSIFRVFFVNKNGMTLHLPSVRCYLGTSCMHLYWKHYLPKTLEYPALRRSVMKLLPNVYPTRKARSIILLSGILTFLGLKKEEVQEPELITTIKRGILCIKRGEVEKAEGILHNALKLAYEEQNEDGIIYIYDLLANLALDIGQNEKANRLFRDVMRRLLDKGYKTDDNKIIHISLKLAKIYENTKEYKKAEIGYKYCFDNLENKVAIAADDIENNIDTLKLWITSLDTYGRFLVSQNRYEEAINIFQRAYDMSVRVNGKEHEDNVLLLNDIGAAYNLMGDKDLAIKYTEKALTISENVSQMENLQTIYYNLGYLYLSKEMYMEAKNACKKGLWYALRDEEKDDIKKGNECIREINELMKNTK